MQSTPQHTTTASAMIDDLQQELVQQRREVAKGHQQLLKRIDELKSGDGAQQTVGRKRVNAAVRSKKFFVSLGAGAEEDEEFEAKWVQLLKSTTASQHTMQCISRLIVKVINGEGRDLRPTDVLLCVAILSAAVVSTSGKVGLAGISPDHSPDHSPARCPLAVHSLSTHRCMCTVHSSLSRDALTL